MSKKVKKEEKKAEVVSKVEKRRKKAKKVGFFGLAPIKRVARGMGIARVSNGVLELIENELEWYCREILNGCLKGAKERGRKTLREEDFGFAFEYVIKKPST